MSDGSAPALVDLHNHLLPMVDDGCRSLEESLRYLASFHRQGVERMAFTPHLVLPRVPEGREVAVLADHRRAFELVQRDASEPSVLRLAQEVCAPTPDQVLRVADRDDVGYPGTDYLLVEFGFQREYDASGVLATLRAHGRAPVLAHPERYHLPEDDAQALERMASWREAGALLQVNGGSLLGSYGDRVGRRARLLLDEGLVDLVASDHHGDFRPDDPGPVAGALASLVGEAGMRRLMAENPGRILDGEAVASTPLALPRKGD